MTAFLVGVAYDAAGNATDVYIDDAPPPEHVVSGAEFLALFTPAEIAALWGADPRLMAGALKVAAQDSCNLDSPECAQLMALAVAKGALAAGRVVDVLAGRPVA